MSARHRATITAAGLAVFIAGGLWALAVILRPSPLGGVRAAPRSLHTDSDRPASSEAPRSSAVASSSSRPVEPNVPTEPADRAAQKDTPARQKIASSSSRANEAASRAGETLPEIVHDPKLVSRIHARIVEYEMLASKKSNGKVAGHEVSVAVHVREAGKRGDLVSIESDRPMRPASNMKLVTSSAALVLLGADWDFDTVIESSAPLENGVLKGDLVVRAAGDPLYDRGPGGERGPSDERGDGSVAKLLAPALDALGKRGLRSVEGALVLDELDFAPPSAGPAWPTEGQRWAEFCALAGGFSANAGCLTANVRPSKSGGPADVRVEPAHNGLERKGRVATAAPKSKLDVRVEARAGSVLVDGSIPSSVPSWSTRFSVPDPVELFGSVLSGELAQHGIAIHGGVRRAHEQPTGRWEELARIETPLLTVIDAMNTDSNNACADQVFFALGHARGGAGTREGGRAAVAKALELLGINANGLVQVDGSGLSRDDRVTARQITALISAVLRQDEATSKAFVDSLAVASESGTLDDRMTDKRLAGRVHAKTGFIAGTSALSGILEAKDGRRLVFSILVEYPNYDGLNRECWKPMEDAICAELAGADDLGG
jgi:D-alanyl-D-alanine carboxypeptidase/D-alanyl-D-alanine-endopeptidase (penicillin-binding protein 4)